MKHWMFSCKEVSEKISESMDRKLPFHHRMFIRMHLMMCRYCSRFKKQMIILRNISRLEISPVIEDTASLAVLSPQARERMKNKLKAYT